MHVIKVINKSEHNYSNFLRFFRSVPIYHRKFALSLMKYIDLAGAKSEALVNNTYKQKELNRVFLNGDDNENGFKTNRSN